MKNMTFPDTRQDRIAHIQQSAAMLSLDFTDWILACQTVTDCLEAREAIETAIAHLHQRSLQAGTRADALCQVHHK